MTLQERLRALAAQEERDVAAGFDGCSLEHTKAEREAADALDAQESRIRKLEGALREIAKGMRGWQIMYASECRTIAREALK